MSAGRTLMHITQLVCLVLGLAAGVAGVIALAGERVVAGRTWLLAAAVLTIVGLGVREIGRMRDARNGNR